MKPTLRLLALTGLLGALTQIALGLSRGGSTPERIAVIGCALLPPLWLRLHQDRTGDPGRLLLSLISCTALWWGVLEIALLVSVPMARGLLVLSTLAGLYTAAVFAATRTAPPGKVGRNALGVLVFVALTLATLATLETGTRFLSPLRSYELIPDDPAFGPCLERRGNKGLEGVPGCSGYYVHREFTGVRAEFNDLGLRDGLDEVTPPADGEASVLVLGDSFAYGLGVSLEETFQQRLGASLAERAVPTRVYGAGRPGTGTAHQRRTLGKLFPLASPDVVVLALFEGNDLQDNWAAIEEDTAVSTIPMAEPNSPSGFLASATTLRFWRTASSLLQLRRVDGRPTRTLRRALEEPLEDRIELMRQAVIDQVLAIERAVQEGGAHLVVLLVPDIVQAEPSRFAELQARHPDLDLSRTGFHQQLRADLEALGLDVLDPMQALTDEGTAGRTGYFREGHWNAHGHELIGQLLLERLLPLLAPNRPQE